MWQLDYKWAHCLWETDVLQTILPKLSLVVTSSLFLSLSCSVWALGNAWCQVKSCSYPSTPVPATQADSSCSGRSSFLALLSDFFNCKCGELNLGPFFIQSRCFTHWDTVLHMQTSCLKATICTIGLWCYMTYFLFSFRGQNSIQAWVWNFIVTLMSF